VVPVEYSDYVAAFVKYGARIGFPKSISQVLGYLLICQPVQQSSDDIKQALALSTGAVNNALQMLQSVNLVLHTRQAGSRRFYYYLDPQGWQRTFDRALQSISAGKEIAQLGLKLDVHNERLRSMHDLYAQCEREFAELVHRLRQQS
jgi:DNA-binding transcriptional regulator GbsR (MarR family)